MIHEDAWKGLVPTITAREILDDILKSMDGRPVVEVRMKPRIWAMICDLLKKNGLRSEPRKFIIDGPLNEPRKTPVVLVEDYWSDWAVVCK